MSISFRTMTEAEEIECVNVTRERAVLDGVAAELRRIIGNPAPATRAETKLRLSA
jgi:hypothetical protein